MSKHCHRCLNFINQRLSTLFCHFKIIQILWEAIIIFRCLSVSCYLNIKRVSRITFLVSKWTPSIPGIRSSGASTSAPITGWVTIHTYSLVLRPRTLASLISSCPSFLVQYNKNTRLSVLWIFCRSWDFVMWRTSIIFSGCSDDLDWICKSLNVYNRNM